MTEKIKSEMISRRRALGLLAALAFVVPPTVLMVSDAEAQPATAPAPAPIDEKTGTERRHERREHRRERRHERRKHRRERHEERRKHRRERDEERSTGTEEKK